MIRLLDVVLCLVAIETIGLLLLHHRKGRGLPPSHLLGTMGAGFLLMLTARLALTQTPWFVLCGVLFLALCAHAADLGARWR